MDCREEVAILERRLKHLPGLEELVPDLVGQRLRVRYDAAKLSTSFIVEAVAQTGMRAWLEHEQPVGHTAAATARQTLVVISGVGAGRGPAARVVRGSSAGGSGRVSRFDRDRRHLHGAARPGPQPGCCRSTSTC